MVHPNILDPARTALVVVDVQEAFRHTTGDFSLIASRISTAVRGFQILGLPVIVTEQYPKGLGRTAEEIMFTLPSDFEVVEKTAFSSCGADAFVFKLQAVGANQIVLCGLETHICVSQTAHDLLERGLDVHLLTDCVVSRFDHDRQSGLAKMQRSGVIPSSTEMAFFELMRDAKHAAFKEIQSIIK
ncbi:MAG: isochorismatase family protein [Pyrinomonadaceae bacterium]